MAIVLFNPTDDELRAQYAGVDVVVTPFGQEGHKVRVDDQKARHILNILGPRGLTSLDYGDEGETEERKARDGRRRSIDFKKAQIRRYNRDNESRRNRNQEYVEPPDFIKEWAKDLGLSLMMPYELPDVNMEEISTLRSEKKELMKLVEKQSAQLTEVMNVLHQKGIVSSEEEKIDEEIQELSKEYKMMNRQQFEPWVNGLGFETFSEFPLAIQTDILTKWEGFFDPEEKPFPY